MSCALPQRLPCACHPSSFLPYLVSFFFSNSNLRHLRSMLPRTVSSSSNNRVIQRHRQRHHHYSTTNRQTWTRVERSAIQYAMALSNLQFNRRRNFQKEIDRSRPKKKN